MALFRVYRIELALNWSDYDYSIRSYNVLKNITLKIEGYVFQLEGIWKLKKKLHF